MNDLLDPVDEFSNPLIMPFLTAELPFLLTGYFQNTQTVYGGNIINTLNSLKEMDGAGILVRGDYAIINRNNLRDNNGFGISALIWKYIGMVAGNSGELHLMESIVIFIGTLPKVILG